MVVLSVDDGDLVVVGGRLDDGAGLGAAAVVVGRVEQVRRWKREANAIFRKSACKKGMRTTDLQRQEKRQSEINCKKRQNALVLLTRSKLSLRCGTTRTTFHFYVVVVALGPD